MPIPPETMQILLLLCIIGCALLAMLYLRERQLTLFAYTLWGLLALCLPLLGPMLVIITRPGSRLRKPTIAQNTPKPRHKNPHFVEPLEPC